MSISVAKPPVGAHVTYAQGTSSEACGVVMSSADSLQGSSWGALVEWHVGRRKAFEAVTWADFHVGLVKVTPTCSTSVSCHG